MQRRRPQRRLAERAEEGARVVDEMLDLLGLLEPYCRKPQFADGKQIEQINAAGREGACRARPSSTQLGEIAGTPSETHDQSMQKQCVTLTEGAADYLLR